MKLVPKSLAHRALTAAAGPYGILPKSARGVQWVPRYSSNTIKALQRAGVLRSDGSVYRATEAGRAALASTPTA